MEVGSENPDEGPNPWGKPGSQVKAKGGQANAQIIGVKSAGTVSRKGLEKEVLQIVDDGSLSHEEYAHDIIRIADRIQVNGKASLNELKRARMAFL